MIGIALHFGGAAQMTFHQQPGCDAGGGHRRGVEQRLSGHHFLRLPHVGDDHFLRLLGAGRSAGQRQRRTHQSQKPAPRRRIIPVGSPIREFFFDESAELFGLRHLFQTPPIPRAGCAL